MHKHDLVDGFKLEGSILQCAPLTMTGFGRASSTHTQLSGCPNKQPRDTPSDSSLRWEEEPFQKAHVIRERLLLNDFRANSGLTSPADTCIVSVGRGFRMNWHCLYACICSTCMASCLSAGDAAASLPPPPPPWLCLTWLIWILKGNSWPETQERQRHITPRRLVVTIASTPP